MSASYLVGDVFDRLAELPDGSVDLVVLSVELATIPGTINVMPESTPIPGRWIEKIAVNPSGCWLWTAAVDRDGYGKFQYPGPNGQVHTRAHRWAYEHFVGPIREGEVVMHRCDTPSCVNPNHLDTGTPLANNDDKLTKGRGTPVWGRSLTRARQTHCIHGHLLSGRNLWINPKTGHRRCRQCSADRAREAYNRKKGGE